MNTKEITERLSHLECFAGTYAVDKLPYNVPKKPAAFVINTDPSTLPGQHWVAAIVLPNGKCEYFDSFGFPPLNGEIYDFLTQYAPNGLSYNSRTLQSATSETCGKYCILFIKMRCNGHSFCDFITQFSKRTVENDQLINYLE